MNQLPGVLMSVQTDGGVLLAEVEAVGRRFTALLLQAPDLPLPWQPGAAVNLSFKETEVALARGLSGDISLRNRQPATVLAVTPGRLLSAVALDFAGQPLTAVITTGSAERLGLAPGVEVEWLVKANEMTLTGAP